MSKMILRDAINKLLKDNNQSHRSMANMLGYSSSSVISNRLANNNMQVDNLVDMCNALGYEVVIKPIAGDNKAERTITIVNESGADK